jgi:hypothetical protein
LNPKYIKFGGATVGQPMLVKNEEYSAATPDAVMVNSRSLLESLNRDQREFIVRLCHVFGGDEATDVVKAFIVSIIVFTQSDFCFSKKNLLS